MDRKVERDVRERLVDVYQREGKVTERELLRISAITGVDYLTVSKTLDDIVLRRVDGADSDGE